MTSISPGALYRSAQKSSGSSVGGLAAISAISLAGAALSVSIQGFFFGGSNNIFHLPFLLDLYNDEQFRDDIYIQSIRYFVSSFWVFVKPLVTDSNAYVLFLILQILSRALTFAGFLACAQLLGVNSLLERLIFAAGLSLVSTMQGWSAAGAGGLFINHFTHSEIVNGLTLLILFMLLTGRTASALVLNGVAFSVNAFMGAWNLVPIGLLLAQRWWTEPGARRDLVQRTAIGAVGFLALALPTVVWIGAASTGQPAYQPFEYIQYLRELGAPHFLLDGIRDVNKIYLVVVVLLALMSLSFFDRIGQQFTVALFGFALVYMAGVAAPYVTGSRLILNLHLLRVSYAAHLLATLGILALLVRWLTSSRPVERGLLGPALALTACTSHWLAPLTLLVLLAAKLADRLPRAAVAGKLAQPAARTAVAIVCGATILGFHVGKARSDLIEARQSNAVIEEWRQIGDWAQRATPANAMFLLPFHDLGGVSVPFEALARRRQWVCGRCGAAVMWAPWYYATWSRRIDETSALGSPDATMTYAQKHGIDYVVAVRGELGGQDHTAVFQTLRLAVFAVRPR